MPASLNRRRFARNTAFAGAGAILAGIGFHRFGHPRLASTERQILSKLSELFPRILLRDLKTEGSRSLHAAVAIDEVDAFLDAGRRHAVLPDVKIHSYGNTLSFDHQGTSYQLDLLLPADFAKQSGESVPI